MSLVKEFRTRRDMIVKGLNDIGFDCMMPDGAFYVFPDVGQLGFDGSALSEKLLNETYVIVTPGIAFGPGCENRVRISYANSRERIAEGIKRIEKALNKQTCLHLFWHSMLAYFSTLCFCSLYASFLD